MFNQNCAQATISVSRVLDSCRKQLNLEHATIELRAIQRTAVAPYTFICASSVEYSALVSNLSIQRLCDKPNKARVKCNVTVPLNVTISDSRNVRFNVKSKITVPEDVVLYVPEPSVFPFDVRAAASCNCPSGSIKGTEVECTACLTIITKVVTEADLVVPCYGYGQVPAAQDFEHNACEKFFKMPLYPTGK